METRTHVTIHTTSGVSEDEARRALADLVRDRPFGPVEVWGSRDEPKTFFVSLEGDVEDAVRHTLTESTSLPFTIEVWNTNL